MSYYDEVCARAEALLPDWVTSQEFVDHCDPEALELESLMCFFPDLTDYNDIAAHRTFVRHVAQNCIKDEDYEPELIEPWLNVLFASPRLAEAMRLWLDTVERDEDLEEAWFLPESALDESSAALEPTPSTVTFAQLLPPLIEALTHPRGALADERLLACLDFDEDLTLPSMLCLLKVRLDQPRVPAPGVGEVLSLFEDLGLLDE